MVIGVGMLVELGSVRVVIFEFVLVSRLLECLW